MDAIDDIDKRLLRLLQQDAKLTTKELAAQLNLTLSPVYERIRRLENLGYIRQYVAVLDKSLLGQHIMAFCQVSMRYHDKAFINKFEEEIQKLTEVQECYHMAGQVDFLLKIHVGSLNEYHDFVKNKLSQIENIGVLNSTFVLKEIKHDLGYHIA